MKLLPLLIALTLSTPAVASIDSDLGQFFDGLNYNTTNPQAYKGQLLHRGLGLYSYPCAPSSNRECVTAKY